MSLIVRPELLPFAVLLGSRRSCVDATLSASVDPHIG
jgi:hypothetical protein